MPAPGSGSGPRNANVDDPKLAPKAFSRAPGALGHRSGIGPALPFLWTETVGENVFEIPSGSVWFPYWKTELCTSGVKTRFVSSARIFSRLDCCWVSFGVRVGVPSCCSSCLHRNTPDCGILGLGPWVLGLGLVFR